MLKIIDIKIIPCLLVLKKKVNSCLVCGPKMKSYHSKILRNEVIVEYRYFLSNNHRYRSVEKHIFNGNKEIILRPWRLTPRAWKLQYNRVSQSMD